MPTDTSARRRSLRLVDVDVGGDVHRVVLSGVNPCPGTSVRERMDYLEHQGDGLRRLLINEPFGNEAMCVDLVMPAALPEAELGYVIMEVMGYPYYSGSNTIATAAAVLEAGLVPMREGIQTVRLESPGGLVTVTAENRAGRVMRVTTRGGSAFIQASEQQVEVPGLGRVTYDLAWSGGYYLLVDAAALGMSVTRGELPALADAADAIVRAVQPGFEWRHPELGDVGLPRFVHFMGPVSKRPDGGLTSPSVTYGHPGVIWRCPTGTGTCARMARLAARGELAKGGSLETVSAHGNAFEGEITGAARVGDYPAIDATITARPYLTAWLDLTLELDAPMVRSYGLDGLLAGAPPSPAP